MTTGEAVSALTAAVWAGELSRVLAFGWHKQREVADAVPFDIGTDA